jgi:hypothetical protein
MDGSDIGMTSRRNGAKRPLYYKLAQLALSTRDNTIPIIEWRVEK